MARLDDDRKNKLEPKRMLAAKCKIESLGYQVFEVDNSTLVFQYKDHEIKYYPYSGWATGKSIKDGRGLQNLINQIK